MNQFRQLLIILAALANTSLWVKAGQLAEGNDFLATFSAACLGLAISFGLVYIAEQWATMPDEVERRIPRTKPAEYEQVANRRKQIAAWSFGGVLAIESLMLAPVIMALDAGVKVSVVLAPVLMWFWAFGRPLAAVAVMGGLAVVAPVAKVAKHVAQPEQPTGQPENNQPGQKQQKRNRAAKVVQLELTDVSLVEYMAQPGTTQAKAAEYFGVRPQAISKRLGKIKSQTQEKG